MRIAVIVAVMATNLLSCETDCTDRSEPYPVAEAQPLGGPCPTGLTCAEGLTCLRVQDRGRNHGSWELTCTIACADDADCPQGAACAGAGAEAPGVCLPKCSTAADCDYSVRETRCESGHASAPVCIAKVCRRGEAECPKDFDCIGAVCTGGCNPYPGEMGWCQRRP